MFDCLNECRSGIRVRPPGPPAGTGIGDLLRDGHDVTTPAEPPNGDATPGSGAAADPDSPAGAGPRPGRRFRWLRILAICTAVMVLALAGGTWYLYQRLNGNITTDHVTETELKVQASQRPPETPTEAENILLIGSDNRGDGNEKYGEDSGTQRSDTTILLHLAADRTSATAVSIPRDLMVRVPECTKPDGTTTRPRLEQFNWAFEAAGAACTIRTVEDMTHIRIDHHLIVDFTGFKNMVDAVDGVEVCVAEPVHDEKAHLDLPAGRQKLDGEQALGYVRARYSLGDGSDTERMQRQQAFLGSLVNKVRSNGVLLNPVKLYPLLDAATKSLTADPGLDSLPELYDLAQSLQKTPTGAIRFLTAPREPYAADHNRDQLLQPAADELFAALHADEPVNVSSDAPSGGPAAPPASTSPATPGTPTSPAGTASPGTAPGTSSPTAGTTPSSAPTFRGTTADRDICGKDQ